MAAVSRGLGKGLDALLKGYGTSESKEEMPDVQSLSLDAIVPNTDQPRQEFHPDTLNELAQSIKSQGVLQPILVRPMDDRSGSYQIVAGERRWRASRLAGLSTIPALIRPISDDDALAIALIENLQREDLNPIEEAEALVRLKEQLGLQQDALAQKVGRSRPAVANAIRLLKLDPEIQKAIREGQLGAGHGRALLGMTDGALRKKLFTYVLAKGLSVREIEDIVSQWKGNGTLPGAVGGQVQKRRARAEVKDQYLRSIQESLKGQFQARVKISGTSSKGKITLSYATPDELEHILSRFGVS